MKSGASWNTRPDNFASEYLVCLELSMFYKNNAFGRWAPEATIDQTLSFVVGLGVRRQVGRSWSGRAFVVGSGVWQTPT